MFEVYDMDPYAREMAIINKEFEVGMMEAAYMEVLLENKLALNKARAELKIMTESTKEYAVGDLVYMYNEAAKEVAQQGEGVFTKIKNTVVAFFIKTWNWIQKKFTKKNTAAYEALQRSGKKFRFKFNPFKYADDAEKLANSISQVPDTVTEDIKSDDIGKKVLAGIGIAVGTGGVIAAIKAFGPKDEETVVKASDAPGIMDKLTGSFGKITEKIQKITAVKKTSNTPNQPQNQNAEGQNGEGDQNNANQQSGDSEKEAGAIMKWVQSIGAQINKMIGFIGGVFGLNGVVDAQEKDAKQTTEEEEEAAKGKQEGDPKDGGGEPPKEGDEKEEEPPKSDGGKEEEPPKGGGEEPSKEESNDEEKQKLALEKKYSQVARAVKKKGSKKKNWLVKNRSADAFADELLQLYDDNASTEELGKVYEKLEKSLKNNGVNIKEKNNKWVIESPDDDIPGDVFTESEMELLNSL